MTNEDLVQRLMATFLEELEGHVRSLSRDLVSLREASSNIVRTDLVDALLRTTHSMKGAAQSVRVEILDRASHLMEEILLSLKSSDLSEKKRANRTALLISAVDAVEDLKQRLQKDADLEGSSLATLLPRLMRTAAQSQPKDVPEPTSTSVATAPQSPGSATQDDPNQDIEHSHASAQIIDTLALDLTGTVRNLAAEVGKQVDIKFSDSGVRADPKLLESLRDPLRHLVRNAVDHGVETPAGRVAAGKSPRGSVTVTVSGSDDTLSIVVADDGAGLDTDGLASEAGRLGLAVPDSPDARARLAFAPGLSTSPIVTRRFGRGIGLDAVHTRIASLGGSIEVRSAAGKGCEWSIDIPLEAPCTEALVVESMGGAYAFPEENVEELRRVRSREVRWILGRPALLADGRVLPIVSLAQLLEGRSSLALTDPRRLQLSGAGVVLRHEETSILLRVDNVVGRQPLRPLSLAQRLRGHPLVQAAGVMDDDRVVLVLSAAAVTESALRGAAQGQAQVAPVSAPGTHRVLLVEASYGTRSALEHVLKSAALDVEVAQDEESALEILDSGHIDLLITGAEDLDRPPSLVGRVREQEKFQDLPIVLLASFDDPAFSRDIADLGASALVRRADFSEQRFLETLRRLLQSDLGPSGESNG